jgi:hypothetical protein
MSPRPNQQEAEPRKHSGEIGGLAEQCVRGLKAHARIPGVSGVWQISHARGTLGGCGARQELPMLRWAACSTHVSSTRQRASAYALDEAISLVTSDAVASAAIPPPGSLDLWDCSALTKTYSSRAPWLLFPLLRRCIDLEGPTHQGTDTHRHMQ